MLSKKRAESPLFLRSRAAVQKVERLVEFHATALPAGPGFEISASHLIDLLVCDATSSSLSILFSVRNSPYNEHNRAGDTSVSLMA